MKKSEAIRTYKSSIAEAMVDRYRKVLDSDGRIQYKIFVWEDGEIECLEGPHGDNSYLAPRDGEPRELYYVITVDEPCFNPWELADHPAPEDDAEREAEEKELREEALESYAEIADDIIDSLIAEAEQEEADDDL